MRWWLLVVVVVAAGCGAGEESAGSPVPTVTVTETVTAQPDEPEAKPTSELSMAGDGDMSSDPFELDEGDYRVEWTTEADCSYGFYLQPLGDQWPRENLGGGSEARTHVDNVYGVEGGRWYLEVITGPAPRCPWSLELRPR